MPILYSILLTLLIAGCQNSPGTKSVNMDSDITSAPGWVLMFQTYTDESQTTINIMRPRFMKASYYVGKDQGDVPTQWDGLTELKVLKTTKGPQVHWELDRVQATGLDVKSKYRIYVVNKFRKKVIDWRQFNTLDLKKKKAHFIIGSCMSDSHAYEHVRSKIWQKMLEQNPEFIVLLGDQVYVDDFDFVLRNKVSKFDLWMRYIDSFRKIPLFSARQLKPIFAVWDDHDYGTNNSDKTFATKKEAKKVFEAFFGGVPIKAHYQTSPVGVSFSFNGFGQKFLMMDNRYDRSSQPKDPGGQWGEKQHQWFVDQVKNSTVPVWLANGGQFFARATVKESHGKKKQINESFIDDHPVHFKKLISELKKAPQPVVFTSGDIHYSEIGKVESGLLGYETYEITSSPIHSFIYRSHSGPESWLENPRRMVSIKEHNFLVVDSQALDKGLEIEVESIGVKSSSPYFKQKLTVKK